MLVPVRLFGRVALEATADLVSLLSVSLRQGDVLVR
jgi:hypothetical protein